MFAGAYTLCWLHVGPHTLAWTLNRATGTAASLLLAFTTATGALLGSRTAPPWLTRALHGLLLTVDPQAPQPLPAALGTLGGYGLLLVVLSTRLSPRVWKALHLTASPAFAALTLHGMLSGSDPLGALYGVAVAAVLFTFGLRLLTERPARAA